MSLRRSTMNENDRAATGPRRSLAPYGGPIFRRGAEDTEKSEKRGKEKDGKRERWEERICSRDEDSAGRDSGAHASWKPALPRHSLLYLQLSHAPFFLFSSFLCPFAFSLLAFPLFRVPLCPLRLF